MEKTTKQKLIEWGWTNNNGQPLSWKYWWTFWQKKREHDETTPPQRHIGLMRGKSQRQISRSQAEDGR